MLAAMQNGLGKLVGQVHRSIVYNFITILSKSCPSPVPSLAVKWVCGVLASGGAAADQGIEEVADGVYQHRGEVL